MSSAVKSLNHSVTRRTMYYFWQVTSQMKGFFVLDLIATFGYVAFLTYGNSYLIGLIVDLISSTQVTADTIWPVYGPYVIALILNNALGQLCSKLQDYALWKMEIIANYNLATFCFDTLSNQSMTFHTNRYGGSLVSQTSKFMNAYTSLLQTFTYSILTVTYASILIVVMLIRRAPVYVCILVVFMAVYVYAAYIMYRKVLPLNAAASAAQNDLSGELSDAVTNILSVKTYGREDYERGLYNDANARALKADTVRMHSSLTRGAMTSTLNVLIMCIVTVFIAGGSVWFGLTAGTLVMMFTYTYNLTMRFNEINSMMQRVNRYFGEASAMTEILDEPRLVEDLPDAGDLTVQEGAIEFHDLSFRYIDADSTDYVFENFNLSIPAGQRVGLVGRSGSGKTTLSKLLLRLSDIQEGQILIDGQNISECTQQSLRRQIAYVPQEALLFHRSIRENIAYGKPDATDEEIIKACTEANAMEFIEKLPHGFDTLVGERGIKLSGGQRQRVAIARAILADAPILLLDEATSALDSESEKLVQDALVNLMRGRTCIVIAHRLSTVASLDRIVVLSDGRITEDGKHSELITKGGEYAGLWNRQTGAFLESDED